MYDLSNPYHPANIVISAVESQLGKGFAWQKQVTGITTDWCAATVVAAGIYTNLEGKVFPKRGQQAVYCAGMCGKAFTSFGGIRIDGPLWGKQNVQPVRGDIIVFVWKNGNVNFYNSVKKKDGLKAKYKEWSASHIGFVTDCKNNRVYTIEGNIGNNTDKSKNYIKKRDYSINNECISFYIRPNWKNADGAVAYTASTTGTYDPEDDITTSTYKIDGVYSTQLYTTESTKADASIREVAFLGSDGKPCINVTGVRLGVINYTGLLSSLYKLTGGTEDTSTTVPDNIDALPTLPRTIVSYLTQKGLNTAASIGITANIQAESNYKTSAVNSSGTAWGICQWSGDFGRQMIAQVGLNWQNNLSGQLDFLMFTLKSSYSSLLVELQKVPNTVEGAKKSADRFLRIYKNPQYPDTDSSKRQEIAEQLWGKIVTTTASSSADYSSTPTVKRFPCPGNPYLVWPIESKPVGKYSSPFGYRGNIGIQGASSYHSGVDIDVKGGTPIRCAANGKVYRSYWNDARGWVIIIDHGKYSDGSGNAYTLYQHMQSKSPITVNSTVKAGQTIGYVGNTGVGNYHLHMEVNLGKTLGMSGVEYYDKSYNSWRNHYAVNPAQYFPNTNKK